MLRTIFKPQLFVILLVTLTANSIAMAKGGRKATEPINTPWKFEIAPYAWLVNMNGDVGVATEKSHINETAADILKYFKGGGMLFLEANKGKVGLFINGIYTRLSKDTSVATAYGNQTINSTSKYGIISAGASYTVFATKYGRDSSFSLEPYIGARYTLNDTTLKVLNSTIIAYSNDQRWTDPILGTRMRFNDRNWRLILAGDIGGINFNNQKSLNLQGIFGYNPSSAQWFTFYVGYKYLYQKYIHGIGDKYFCWNMRLFGPALGLSFNF